jgi:hypothetical protein
MFSFSSGGDRFMAYERNTDDKWLNKSRLAEPLCNECYYFTLKIQHHVIKMLSIMWKPYALSTERVNVLIQSKLEKVTCIHFTVERIGHYIVVKQTITSFME